jgi:hypothetical protein
MVSKSHPILLSRSPNSAYCLSLIANILLLKEVFDHLGLLLPPVKMTAHTAHEFDSVGRTALVTFLIIFGPIET